MLVLSCSRIWLLNMEQSGVAMINFNGTKKRHDSFGRNKTWNSTGYVIFAASLIDNRCLLVIGSRSKNGVVITACKTSIRENGYQCVFRIKGNVYKFSVLDSRTAILEEVIRHRLLQIK